MPVLALKVDMPAEKVSAEEIIDADSDGEIGGETAFIRKDLRSCCLSPSWLRPQFAVPALRSCRPGLAWRHRQLRRSAPTLPVKNPDQKNLFVALLCCTFSSSCSLLFNGNL